MHCEKPTNLDVQKLGKVTSLFSRNQWPIEDSEENNLSPFNRYCKMLSVFNDLQQELILELSSRFLWVRFDHYEKYLHDAVKRIEDEIIKQSRRIYFIPLLHPSDFEGQKSSVVVYYLLKGRWMYFQELAKATVKFIDRPNLLPTSKINNNADIVILIDDFIGSGETAMEAASHIVNANGIDIAKIVILSLVAQEQGVRTLSDAGYRVFTAAMRNKGITDNYASPLRETHINTMREVEASIRVMTNFHFGYAQAEALVSMIRTPNSTFPVYWAENSTANGKKTVAPFPRY